MSRHVKGGRWHFPNAIRKHGKDAFSHEVLEVCHSLDVANLAEECWIELFETRNSEKGFNLAKGGQHTPHQIRKNPWDDLGKRAMLSASMKMAIQRPEVRLNRSAACKLMWQDPDYRAKKSAISKETNARPEVRAKISEAVRASIAKNPRGPFPPEVRAKIFDQDRELVTTCKVHGVLRLQEYYRILSKDGRISRICKACSSRRCVERRRRRRLERTEV